MSDGLRHVLHENGIHEFTFLKPSRQAIDDLYGIMNDLMENAPRPEIVLLLVDVTNGIYPPLRHLFKATQEFNSTHVDAPPGFTAVIAAPNAMVTLAATFMNTLNKFIMGYNRLRFFKTDDRERAIQWLLQVQQQQME